MFNLSSSVRFPNEYVHFRVLPTVSSNFKVTNSERQHMKNRAHRRCCSRNINFFEPLFGLNLEKGGAPNPNAKYLNYQRWDYLNTPNPSILTTRHRHSKTSLNWLG